MIDWREVGGRIGSIGAYIALVGVLGSAAAYAVHHAASIAARQSAAVLSHDFGAPAADAPVRASRFAEDEWSAKLRSEWNSRRSSGSGGSFARPSGLTKAPAEEGFSRYHFRSPQDQERSWSSGSGTHRTMCVRLCDGYYWPISFATSSDNFGRDQQICERSCDGDAKLYVYRNPGGEPEDMVDLRGQPYQRLKNAFLFRTNYDESCKCKPHAWEQEARDRHRIYALEAQKKKGNKAAARELARLRAGGLSAEAKVGSPSSDSSQEKLPELPEKHLAADAERAVLRPSDDKAEPVIKVGSDPADRAQGRETGKREAEERSSRRSYPSQDWRQKILEAR